MKKLNLKLSLLSVALIIAGCSTVKPPEQVDLHLPNEFRETANLDGAWQLAKPADDVDRSRWWSVFNEPELSALIDTATDTSPNLAIALARVKESRANAGIVDSARKFQLNGGAGPTRQRSNTTELNTQWRAQVNASYEVDLIGRLSDDSRAAKLDSQAAEAGYRSILLALQADVAQQYYTIRMLDSELEILNKTIALRKDELRLVQHRYDVGDTDKLDLAKAKTELSKVQADAEGTKRLRAQQDHALAILLGKAPAEFTLAAAPLRPTVVIVPAGLPSSLLERRPDIAQAQRQMAAASARVGVAKAAFFPRLTLTGSAGYQSSQLGDLFKWSSRSWLLGPLVGTALTVPIFDGGYNKANLARADASYELQVANYRQQVLVGFQDVENSLSAINTLDKQMSYESEAVDSSKTAENLANTRYRNGTVSYFDVIDAQRTSLSVELAQLQIAGERSLASVSLIRALGGGWAQN